MYRLTMLIPLAIVQLQAQSLTMQPVTPCRVMDTRAGEGKSGPFGPPTMAAASSRTIPIPQSSCGIPADAKAYSLNITVVPRGTLAYLVAWPTGVARPATSTLNSFRGKVTANAAIVPAGTGGAIDVFVTDQSDVILDINGYYATAPAAMAFYSMQPCRVMDTRAEGGKSGSFGPPSFSSSTTRTVPVPQSSCNVPATAKAYMLNITVIPKGPLAYLTVWPNGVNRPVVSTLNSFDGRIVANAAMVPAGTAGAIDVFATDPTDVVIDISGYFIP